MPERQMKERPIIMQAESVRAILEGRKTQTRRVVKPQPDGGFVAGDGVTNLAVTDAAGKVIACRYGGGSDHLWVKETWRKICLDEPTNLAEKKTEDGDIRYKATSQHGLFGEVWRPSMFMPRWASRLTLEVLRVRIDRVQQISNEDARAEGVYAAPHRGPHGGPCIFETGIDQCFGCSYRFLWNVINEPRGFGWETNPWVWVIEFKRIAPAAAAVGE